VRGIDDRPVHTHRERKSLSTEHTFAENIKDLDEIDRILETMAAEVSRGLEKRQLAASTITVKVRYPDFTTPTRSHTLPVRSRPPMPPPSPRPHASWCAALMPAKAPSGCSASGQATSSRASWGSSSSLTIDRLAADARCQMRQINNPSVDVVKEPEEETGIWYPESGICVWGGWADLVSGIWNLVSVRVAARFWHTRHRE